YFISTSFIVALILVDFFKRSGKKLFYTTITILFIFQLERGIYENRYTFKKNIWWQCAQLQDHLKGEYKVRTEITRFAKLGPCLGLVQNSKTADFGVYEIKKIKKMSLSNYEIIERTQDLVLVKFK